MCWSSAAHTLNTHRIMHAFLALAIALAAPALALASPRDRIDYNRDAYSRGLLPDFILSPEYVAAHQTKPKLIVRPRPDDLIKDDSVILGSNVLNIVIPSKTSSDGGLKLVRERRGYNLENVRVPARYPYLPVPNYNRFRRWG